MEKGSVEIFGLSVGLGMSYQGEVLFDPQILAPCLERVVCKLLFIVRDDDPREPEGRLLLCFFFWLIKQFFGA